MRVSYEWLKDYIDVDLSPAELAERLTAVGLAVEGLEDPGAGLAGLLVGKILSLAPHPDADRLQVCQVDIGKGMVQMVSGAPNLAVGQLVPVALPGAKLPGLESRLQAMEFRGVTSQGMLCSTWELGLGDTEADRAGIMILEEGQPGDKLSSALRLDDVVLVLELTPNYAVHCQSMLGVAREVAMLTGLAVKEPAIILPDSAHGAEKRVRVDVVDTELCPRYSTRIISDLETRPSPLWMQQRLRKAGMRPINNLVDVTNYVMLEMGQPLHAFDYERVQDKRIIVRPALPGELLITLDGMERELQEDDLVIADAKRAIGLAGVMGGENTEVGPATRHVLLESACFHPTTIGRTSRRLGLVSEASNRFHKGVDVNGCIRALDRAAALLAQLGGGRLTAGPIDVYPHPVPPKQILLRPARVNKVLGTELSGEEMANCLERLGLSVRRETAAWQVTVPTRRGDLQEEVDLIEEVARVYGYDRIPATIPGGMASEQLVTEQTMVQEQAGQILRGCGLNEAVTYSFFDRRDLDRLQLPAFAQQRRLIPLANPLREEQAFMRTLLFPKLLEACAFNASHQTLGGAFYEIGPVYLADDLPLQDLPAEELRLAMAAYGEIMSGGWSGRPVTAGFFWLKGVIETLAQGLHLGELAFRPSDQPSFHPGRQASLLCNGVPVGVFGEIHPLVAEAYDIPGPVVAAELDWQALAENKRLPEYRPLARFPAVHRDLALIVPDEIPAARVAAVITAAAGPLLDGIVLFDVYQGQPVPAGSRSLAYSLTYRSPERTLTDAEVDAVHDRVRTALQTELRANLRS
ncbi:MAG TPA: phenylalanine--tRNA ligase subunit beta [Firmicutes bacterium]|jgi:phenylalanyl-tRNA synthetase beta chain|nr:phenylalanine--tRNA ligase subunit beta [Bacillota bacterium]